MITMWVLCPAYNKITTNYTVMKDTLDVSKVDYIKERNELLKDISYEKVRDAWFTMSHLLMDEGDRILDMGCGNGEKTFTMAALNPEVNFIGIDKNREKILEARETYKAPNLKFQVSDLSEAFCPPETIDAIINSYTLHNVFSNALYNERIISDTLRKQFAMLKNGGTMFIRDYAKPPQDQFVLIEMQDKESESEDLADLSEADLLIWYSEHARPKQDEGCGGFFLEEITPIHDGTRLFRLPYKWAYEFIMRKDKREIWESELPFEYTFYTVPEFRSELRSLGARVQYSAPHWDDEHIEKHFDGSFRLLNDQEEPIGDPPTSFIAVALKQPERSSLDIIERRMTKEPTGNIAIKTMVDQHNGKLTDVVTREREMVEILPYRIANDGRLYIYLHDGIVRGITNSVNRSGVNIDGREWSGHMLETLSTNCQNVTELGKITPANTKDFSKSYLGLKPEKDAILEEGPVYYPDPNYIDERIHTYFLPVQKHKKILEPQPKNHKAHNFKAKTVIRELNAQLVLDSIAVGLTPNSRLELQILSLMQNVNIRAENWISRDIIIEKGKITSDFDTREFLRQGENSDLRFKETEESAGQIRKIDSIFVEEGQDHGGRTGISSENMDFIIPQQETINTAVVLPITKSTKGDLHAGCFVKHMPVPQRYEGNGLSVSAPQFNIPPEITNTKMLKQFIASKFGITPNLVMKLGESYFSHTGITPQRIHPFAITSPPDDLADPDMVFIPFLEFMKLWRSISKEQHFMLTIARAYRFLPEHIKIQAKIDVKVVLNNVFKSAQPEWTVPAYVAPVDTQASSINKNNEKHIKKDAAIKKKKLAAKNLDINLFDEFEYEMGYFSEDHEEGLENEPKPER